MDDGVPLKERLEELELGFDLMRAEVRVLTELLFLMFDISEETSDRQNHELVRHFLEEQTRLSAHGPHFETTNGYRGLLAAFNAAFPRPGS